MTNSNEFDMYADCTDYTVGNMSHQHGQQNVIADTSDVIINSNTNNSNCNVLHIADNNVADKHSTNTFSCRSSGSGGVSGSGSKTPIKDFYRNATILITGGTGFVGKVLIQKLLRTFQLRKIYMLIRCKNNMTVEQRLEQYFNESVSV